MGKIIYANVYVDTPTGSKLYEFGSEMPDEHAALITAPVWDKPEPDEDEESPGAGGILVDDKEEFERQKAAADKAAQVEADKQAAAQAAADAKAARAKELEVLKKPELVEQAQSLGLPLTGDETKDVLVELIVANEQN